MNTLSTDAPVTIKVTDSVGDTFIATRYEDHALVACAPKDGSKPVIVKIGHIGCKDLARLFGAIKIS